MKQILTLALFFATSLIYNSVNAQTKFFAKDKFSVEYPSTWRIDTVSNPTVAFQIFSLKENPDDNVIENTNLSITTFDGAMTLDEFAKGSEKYLKENMPNVTGISIKKIKTDDKEYHELACEMVSNGVSLNFTQHYYVQGDKGYIMTFTYAKNTSLEMLKTGNKILDSFKLKSK